MPQPFLTAEWRNLLMANYQIEPSILQKYLPCRIELDSFNGVYYLSLVGFLFKNTRLKGVSIPFHHDFEEVNLRFYVRYNDDGEWKRGVVFIKEIVPKRTISFIANNIYKEKYVSRRMKHRWENDGNNLDIAYYWKVGSDWNYIKAVADLGTVSVKKDSEEEFITEHYWGYTFISNDCTGAYEVIHPKWNIHAVKRYEIKCSVKELYGDDFVSVLNQEPVSVFLADGSLVKVMKKTKIYKSNF
ncbi:MAG: YqjF family protein [Chitinophagaceae bacterium]